MVREGEQNKFVLWTDIGGLGATRKPEHGLCIVDHEDMDRMLALRQMFAVHSLYEVA